MSHKSIFEDSVKCEDLMLMLRALSLWKRNCLADEEIIGLVRNTFAYCPDSENIVRLEGLVCIIRSLSLWQRGGLTNEELLKVAGDVFCN
jgi:hypothetical protein